MILVGDCRDTLRTLADGSAHCVVTSPPYFGLRDYGKDGQIGLEPTPDEFVAAMVEVFREVHRVLRDDGTLWLNLGDSYAVKSTYNAVQTLADINGWKTPAASKKTANYAGRIGLAAKNLIGIPWRVAFALQADGWILRQDIIWSKPNPMPESVRDRCTRSHEYLFMFSKGERYFYDHETVKEPAVSKRAQWTDGGSEKQRGHSRRQAGFNGRYAERIAREGPPETRNKRSVWNVATRPFKEAHFATYPPELIEPCVLASCPPGGVVLDPFFGAGTTGLVAQENGRAWIGCELNPEYVEIAKRRLAPEPPIDPWAWFAIAAA